MSHEQKKLKYKNDFFSSLAKYNFNNILPKIVDFNSDINYLEIGTLDGLSIYELFSKYFSSNSTAVVIDPFQDSQSEVAGSLDNFKYNLHDYLDRITIHENFSNNILPTLNNNSFDLIYIDGSHMALDVYNDLINSFPLLKKNGIIVCDDYLWWMLPQMCKQDTECHPFSDGQPLKGINRFIKEKSDEIELLTKPYFLEYDENNSDLPLPISRKDNIKIFGDDLFSVTKAPLNEINYQMFIKKIV